MAKKQNKQEHCAGPKPPEKIIFNKLVRDQIPGIIASSGSRVTFRALQGEELRNALHLKLLEEAKELSEAKTEEAMIEEIADIYEVIKAIQYEFDISEDEILDSMSDKVSEKGSFNKGFFLETAEV